MIPSSKQEAQDALEDTMLARESGSIGDGFVVEELLEGDKLGMLSSSDGYRVRSLPSAQGHESSCDSGSRTQYWRHGLLYTYRYRDSDFSRRNSPSVIGDGMWRDSKYSCVRCADIC